MNLPRLWTTSQELVDPFRAMRREMENAFVLSIRIRPLPTLELARQRSMWPKQRMPSK